MSCGWKLLERRLADTSKKILQADDCNSGFAVDSVHCAQAF